ncbi:MAG: hypothetical protein EPN84_00560 [Legionella sp.]|nr:MAG: hypothetical protein EPN84_00560 [Legionella sp.]
MPGPKKLNPLEAYKRAVGANKTNQYLLDTIEQQAKSQIRLYIIPYQKHKNGYSLFDEVNSSEDLSIKVRPFLQELFKGSEYEVGRVITPNGKHHCIIVTKNENQPIMFADLIQIMDMIDKDCNQITVSEPLQTYQFSLEVNRNVIQTIEQLITNDSISEEKRLSIARAFNNIDYKESAFALRDALKDSNSELYKALNTHRNTIGLTFFGPRNYFISNQTRSLQLVLNAIDKDLQVYDENLRFNFKNVY